MSEELFLVITPQQKAEGYVELQGVVARTRQFFVLSKLVNGNYIVINPRTEDTSLQEVLALAAAEGVLDASPHSSC